MDLFPKPEVRRCNMCLTPMKPTGGPMVCPGCGTKYTPILKEST